MHWLGPLSAAAFGAVAATRLWRQRRRFRALDGEVSDPACPLRAMPRHLSPGLARVARATQNLRLVVDTPIRRSRDPLLSDLPWVRRQHCDEYDAAIVDLRRALWDWMLELRALDDDELRILREMGLSLRPFRRLLYFEIDRTDDTWEEVLWPTRPDLDSVARLLGTVMEELDRFEAALMTVSTDPYRAAS